MLRHHWIPWFHEYEINSIGKCDVALPVSLDCSKGLDVLDHHILVVILKYCGLSGGALNFFENYLNRRFIYGRRVLHEKYRTVLCTFFVLVLIIVTVFMASTSDSTSKRIIQVAQIFCLYLVLDVERISYTGKGKLCVSNCWCQNQIPY